MSDLGFNKLAIVCLAMVAMLAISGCSHRVLTFFFTGVPDPNAQTAVANGHTAAGEAAIVRVVEIGEQNEFTHGPWVNRRCGFCHANSDGQKFNTTGKITGDTGADAYNRRTLCIGCHKENRFTGELRPLYMHGPTVNGLCTQCHNPHKAKRQYLLSQEDNRQLCLSCHQDTGQNQHFATAGNGDCVACHDPHASERRMLLKAEVLPQ